MAITTYIRDKIGKDTYLRIWSFGLSNQKSRMWSSKRKQTIYQRRWEDKLKRWLYIIQMDRIIKNNNDYKDGDNRVTSKNEKEHKDKNG